jgi:hypothetical protein
MPIDFSDPAQVTNGGKRVPVDTQEKFDALKGALRGAASLAKKPFDDDATQQFEQRVRSGQDEATIMANFLDDLGVRFPGS